MKSFSLFTGIGGFDLALQNKDHQIVGACEIDRYARLIYRKHFPDVPLWEDATKINPEELPDFDLLCAGFPCQAFSLAGKRLGFEDTRGTLFFEIARIAGQKRPKLLLLENVKGLLSHDRGKTFANILTTMDELGYDAEWQVFNSKYWVPQNRERIFIIGHLRNEGTKKIFPIKEDGGVSVKGQEATTVRTLTGGGHSRGLHSQMTMILLSHTKGNIKQRIQDKAESWTVDTSGNKQAVIINNHGELQERDICSNLDANYYKGCDTYGARSLIVLKNDKHSTNRLYDPDGISRTLRANAGGKGSKTGLYKTIEGIRRLTPLECERLQGFPDGWTEGVSDTQRYKQLGNAVTVPVVEFILERLFN